MNGERAAPRERLEWMDAARGLGIIAVVIGHVWTRGALRDAVYSFHMPLFFLLSGYLFRPQSFAPFARRQVATQGLTYLAYLLLVLALDLGIEGMRGHRPIFHDWPGDIWRIALGGSELRGPFTVFWFVPCLLFARLLCTALGQGVAGPASWGWALIAAISLALAYGIGAITDFSPLGLLSVPMALVLLWAGWVWRGVAWRPWMLALLVPLSLLGLFLAPPLNMKAGDYGWPIISVAGAVATSFLFFRAAQLPVLGSAPLRLLGQASLVIMYLHVPVVHYLTPYCSKPVLLVLAILIPLAAYYAFATTRLSARLFLGKG